MNGQTVSKGLSTWAGLIAAAGQYAGAVAVFLNDPDKATALGPLTTATATLIAVIYGRMSQAKALAAPAPTDTWERAREIAPEAGWSASTATRPRPSVDMSTVQGGIGMPPVDVARRSPDPQDFSDEVPGGGVPPELAS